MKKNVLKLAGVLGVMALSLLAHAGQPTLTDNTILDLQTAQKIALADNPSLFAAAERVEQALQRIEQAHALYQPQLDLSGGASWSELSENAALSQTLSGTHEIDRDQQKTSLALVASWQLFDGFFRKFQKLSAEYGGKQSEQARRNGQRLLLQSVAEAYYNAHLALYQQKIAAANRSFNQQQLKEAEIRYNQGAGSLSNVLNFKVQINQAQTDFLTAQRNYQTALFSLAVLMGRETARFPKGLQLTTLKMIEQSTFLSVDPEQLIERALRLRPDYLLQQARSDQSNANISRAKAAFYPKVSLSGSVDGAHSEELYLEGEDFGATLGLSCSYNLYHGGADQSKLIASKAAHREELRNLAQKKNSISQEVRTVSAGLQLAQKQLTLQRSTTELVTQTRDLVKDGYDAGQESLVRLNEAQRDLVKTQSNLALALVGLYRYLYQLKSVTGESLLPFYRE